MLPKGWATSALGDVCDLLNGRAYKQEELLDTGKWPVLRVGNFFSNPKWYFSDLQLDNDKYCDDGDLLYAWSASFGPRIWSGGKVIYHYHIWKTRPEARVIDQGYLFRWFDWDTKNIKADHGTGTTMIHVTKGDMEQRKIPIPPLAEQRRIVAKLDAMTTRFARAREDLNRVLALTKRLRLATLNDVFNRFANAPRANIATVCRVGTGSTPKKGERRYYENGDIAWVTSTVVNQNIVDVPTALITQTAIRETNCKVFPSGSLIIALYGEGKTRGMIAELAIPAATNQALAVLHSFDESVILPSWIRAYFVARYEQTRSEAAGGVQPNLNLGIIKSVQIPLPSMDEQMEAVAAFDAAFACAYRLEAEAARARALLDRLESAILAKAFRGELVPQDPNDEPASVLLDRIRAERAAAPKPKRGRRAAADA